MTLALVIDDDVLDQRADPARQSPEFALMCAMFQLAVAALYIPHKPRAPQHG